MRQKVKKKWVEALRSGDYEQGQERLVRDGKYCCLGVLCDLAEQEGVVVRRTGGLFQDPNYAYDDSSIVLPKVVQKWAGLKDGMFKGEKSHGEAPHVTISGEVRPLSDHNDNGKDFIVIADAIERDL